MLVYILLAIISMNIGLNADMALKLLKQRKDANADPRPLNQDQLQKNLKRARFFGLATVPIMGLWVAFHGVIATASPTAFAGGFLALGATEIFLAWAYHQAFKKGEMPVGA